MLTRFPPLSFLGRIDGLCLNSVGEVFSWGKGERGQLGHELGATESKESHTGQPIQRAIVGFDASKNNKPLFKMFGKVSQISAGMIHSAALEADTNEVYLWGKYVVPLQKGGDDEKRGRKASDGRLPILLKGLPSNLAVERIACGSHHTSCLLEDGSVWTVGLSTDTQVPVHQPVCLIEAGIVTMPVRQFAAHMDRTTVIDKEGQVLQVHLWQEKENRDCAVFTPSWVDPLLQHCEAGTRIREIHRSWLHTIVVTEKD